MTTEEEKYVLTDPVNKNIFDKVQEAEQIMNLSDEEKLLLGFLRTQLERDWQTPCIKMLDEMIKGKELTVEERVANMKKVIETEEA